MGTIPSTGSAITMGRVRNAYGLSGQVSLRATLGAQIGITTGVIRLSDNSDQRGFGGRVNTPGVY